MTLRITLLSLFCTLLVTFSADNAVDDVQSIELSVQANAQQGDRVEITAVVGQFRTLRSARYRINELEGAINAERQVITYNTCKFAGEYQTSLNVWGQATYQDGTVRTFGPRIVDLTTSRVARNDRDRHYAVYISHDNDGDREDLRADVASAFMDEFEEYSRSQYNWAEPRLYTGDSIRFVNSVDMAISMGHGGRHSFQAGPDGHGSVNLALTEFGSFAPCGSTGDAKYLVFASCKTLSNSSIANELLNGGASWGEGRFPTGIAFGDVDGDGKKEVGFGRMANENDRFWIKDDASAHFANLLTTGNGWGAEVTGVAFGDVDGDGRDEVGIARRTSESDTIRILDDSSSRFAPLFTLGQNWGEDRYATSIAFGDVDGDGRKEIGITRNAGPNARFYVLDDARNRFAQLHAGGGDWSESASATSIAFGDVDGDGKDEVGVGRKFDEHERFRILDDATHNFAVLHTGGENWGGAAYTTCIAFGDVDGDGKKEVGIARKASGNARYYVLDDAAHQFAALKTGGEGWGEDNYATWIAFGDVDNDGRDEVGVARHANTSTRYWILNDATRGFASVHSSGDDWKPGEYATCIAFGDTNGDGKAEVGVTRKADSGRRLWVLEDYPGDGYTFGRPWGYYWFHSDGTKAEKRPFTGLHMALGFRTNFRTNYDWTDNDSSDFFETFAENLDDGMKIRDAWHEAAEEDLDFDDNTNLTSVFYLLPYANDTIQSNRDHYIFGNAQYQSRGEWLE